MLIGPLVDLVDVPGTERYTVAQWADGRGATGDAAQILAEETESGSREARQDERSPASHD